MKTHCVQQQKNILPETCFFYPNLVVGHYFRTRNVRKPIKGSKD